MARKKVTADNLQETVKQIINDRYLEIKDDVYEVTKITAQNGAKAIKNTANSLFDPKHQRDKGRYGNGWTYKVERSRLNVTGVIYNKNYPWLAHLLENGHETRGGGRKPVEGREHIAPVERQITEDFIKDLNIRIEQ